MLRYLFSVFCPLSSVLLLRARSIPKRPSPITLQVILHVAPHRLLTDVFKEQLARELRDTLKAALGDLAEVEILDKYPSLEKIEARGLQVGLDGRHRLTDAKKHFVFVDFKDGEYDISARQIDGWTSLASPVMRTARTADRPFVARTAALLIQRDFGIDGTLDKLGGSRHYGYVERRRHCRQGDAELAVVPVKSSPSWRSRAGGMACKPSACPGLSFRRWATRRRQGNVRGRLFQRYKDSVAAKPNVEGYRCVKLGTSNAPLRMQFVKEQTLQPIVALAVTVSPPSLTTNPFDLDEKGGCANGLSSDRDGFIQTKDSYKHIAFVRVTNGSEVLARIPVEILEGYTLTCPLSSQGEAKGEFKRQYLQWIEQINEALLVQEGHFKQINKLIGDRTPDKALQKSRDALADLKADLDARGRQGDELKKLAQELNLPDAEKLLADGKERLHGLERRQTDLDKAIANLDEVVRQANDPKRANLLALVEKARLLETEAEYDQALATYEEILKDSADQPEVRARGPDAHQ